MTSSLTHMYNGCVCLACCSVDVTARGKQLQGLRWRRRAQAKHSLFSEMVRPLSQSSCCPAIASCVLIVPLWLHTSEEG